FGERVAVALAVRGAHERRDDLDVPLADLAGLAPEVGEPEVDVELEEVNPRRSLRHGPSVEAPSDGYIAGEPLDAGEPLVPPRAPSLPAPRWFHRSQGRRLLRVVRP